MDASKLHDEAPSPFAPKTFTPTSGSVNQKTATAVQKVLDTVHGISGKEPEKVSGGLFGGPSTASTTYSASGASTGSFGSVSSGSEKSGLFQVKKEVTKTQSIASSGGFNFGTPKKDTKAEIPKPSLFGSSAPPSGDSGASGGIFGKKPEAKPSASEVEKAPEKKSIFGKPSGGSTGGIFGSSAPSGGGIFGSAPAKPTENPFASKAPSTPKANPFGSKSAGVNPFGSASSGGGGGLFGSTSTKTPVKEYKFNEEKESEDENDETEDEVSGDEEEDSAEDQSADETLIPNRQSDEPPVETKVGFKLFFQGKRIFTKLSE